jgi:uncharacterized membrane protein
MFFQKLKNKPLPFVKVLPFILCILFFIAFATLSIIRHNHYGSFGYDLGINDQVVWRYSQFQLPITTIGPIPDTTKLAEHVELVYIFVAPFYWLWRNPITLILVRTAWFCASGIAIYLLAKKRELHNLISLALVVGYLGFFGVQNAMWFDVHSASFASAFLAWFLYFFDNKNRLATLFFFLLAIIAKENIAFILLFIGAAYFLKRKDKMSVSIMLMSIAYLFFVFFIYFPYIIRSPYLYQNNDGLLSNLNPIYMFNTAEKLQTEFYTLISFGFLPLFNPLTLLPAIADLATYFVIGSDLPGAQGLYMHYRVTLAPLLAWASIIVISRRKFLNTKYTALYLFVFWAFTQYTLHLPVSYLTKSWFWQEPSAVKNINTLIKQYLPPDASVVSQNNITPHISHRDQIYTLYPEKEEFLKNSPCGQRSCDWFQWHDSPEFLIADTSTDWDARHLLVDRGQYIKGLQNLEAEGVIKNYKQIGNAVLYKVLKTPGT